jgi:uncharacterized protein YbaP (TraB family)
MGSKGLLPCRDAFRGQLIVRNSELAPLSFDIMKTRRAYLGWFLFLVVTAAWRPVRAEPAKPAPAAARHSLWKVDGKKNTVYLLGSVHFLKEGDYPLPPAIEAAFTNSQIAVFETDVGSLATPETQQKLMEKAMLPEGQTLEQQLPPETYKTLKAKLEASGLPSLVYERFKPSMAAMMLEVLQIKELGFDPEFGLDTHYYNLAREQGKETRELETLDFQLGLATDFTRQEGELVVKSTLKGMDKTRQELGSLMKAWQTGDSGTLEVLLNEALQEAPVIYKRFLTDRNQRWVPQLEEMARGGKNVIVIVGAGHLVGKEGVVELLKKKGWKVTQQ